MDTPPDSSQSNSMKSERMDDRNCDGKSELSNEDSMPAKESVGGLFSKLNKGGMLTKASGVFLIRILGTIATFCFHVAIARLFGDEGTGTFFLALTVVTIANVIGRLGLDHVVLRLVAAHSGENNWPSVSGVMRNGRLTVSVLGTLLASIVWLVAPWLSINILDNPAMLPILRIMACGIPIAGLTILQGQALKGLGHARLATLVEISGVALLNVGLAIPFGMWLGLKGIGITWLVSNFMMLMTGLYLWRRSLPQIQDVRGSFPLKTMVQMGLPLLWVTSMNLVMNWTDTFMLGIWTTASDVGVYGVAIRAANLTSFLLVAVNSVVAPKFAALYHAGKNREVAALARRATMLTSATAIPVLLAFLFFGRSILSIFGGDFTVGETALSIIIFGRFANVITGPVAYLLIMSGKERWHARTVLGSSLTNVILNILLIPRFGIVGAAIATSISMAVHNFVELMLVRRGLGFWTLPFLRGYHSPVSH